MNESNNNQEKDPKNSGLEKEKAVVENKNETAPKKPLAVVILIAVVVLIAWLAIQLVNILPTAISSIASLADSVYNHDPKKSYSLEVKVDNELLNSGDTVNISWNERRESDRLVFSYDCQEGMSVDIKNTDGEFESLNCDDLYELDDRTSIELRINSERSRFSDLTYNIDLYKKDSSSPDTTESRKVTVINPNINSIAVSTSTEETDTDTDQDQTDEDSHGPEPDQNVQQPPAVVVTAPIYTYEIPTSDPNGVTNLVVSDLNIGIIGVADTFIKNDTFVKGVRSGVQFTVHNIGTRTSEDWTYTVTLPGGTEYRSKTQTPLKPNERSIVTIMTPKIDEVKLQTIKVSVDSKRELSEDDNDLEGTFVVIQ